MDKMPFPFHITEFVIDGQHIREYPRATSTPNTPPKICIKKYTPVDNLNPRPGDVTIVAAQGTGYPKELYEPLWQDLLSQSEKIGWRIRAIWMADAFNQGASGILNEQILGNDPSWYDYSRDLIHMINCFHEQMPQPIVGIGHSLGAGQLVFASLFHPRLFTSLAFVEPYIGTGDYPGVEKLLQLSTLKRDTWPSRAVAIEKARKVFKRWDPRVFELWAKHGYRDLSATSTADSVTEQDGKDTPTPPPVTLATTKHQETLMYARLAPNNDYAARGYDEPWYPQTELVLSGMKSQDWHLTCRAEASLSDKMVVYLRPSVLYVSGSRSDHCRNGRHKRLAEKTGTAFGEGARMSRNRVQHIVIEKASHSLPQEEVGATAEAVATWMSQQLQQWQRKERESRSHWAGQLQKSALPSEWISAVEYSRSRPSKI